MFKTDMFSSQSHFHGSKSNGWFHESHLPPQTKKMPIRNQVHGAKPQCTNTLLLFDKSNMNEELGRSNTDVCVCQGTQGDSEVSLESEMQEDTEEINALLYSEDDSSEEDEVTSIVSAHRNQEDYGQSKKRKKVFDESYDSVLNAESSCGSCGDIGMGFVKRSKPFGDKLGEEKIFETVRLLRSIVPGEEEENPILVIDRAIDYLRSLKMEADKLEENGTLWKIEDGLQYT